jgi:SagB-type dehydrogenase family enzyme
MDLDNVYPYLVCGGYQDNGKKWIFLTPFGEVEIKNVNNVISSLLPLCRGELSFSEIIGEIHDQFGDMDGARDFILKLFELKILSDKYQVYRAWKTYGENPMVFFREINEREISSLMKSDLPKDEVVETIEMEIPHSELRGFLNGRCSTRKFSSKPVNARDIAGLFWTSYGFQENRDKIWKYGEEKTLTVPSGGGLYPLVLYLVHLKDEQDLKKGIYRWNNQVQGFDRLKYQSDIENLEGIITGIESLKNATGLMIIAADYERVSSKYANKSYPLVLLEAGHVMQNAYLYCAERGIGFVELLGFDHEELLKNIAINKKLDLVVVGVFGAMEEWK